MNSTTGAEATALSMALRVSVERKDFWRDANLEEMRGLRLGRRACEAVLNMLVVVAAFQAYVRRTEKAVLENMATVVISCRFYQDYSLCFNCTTF